jgi:hypothetical protein
LPAAALIKTMPCICAYKYRVFETITCQFETITAASGSYGCEIWSTPLLSSWDAITSCSLQRYQAWCTNERWGCLTAPATNMLASFEMGRYPLQISWLVRTVKYWNKRVADTTNDHNRAVAHLPPDSRLQLGLHPGCHELLRSYSTLSHSGVL